MSIFSERAMNYHYLQDIVLSWCNTKYRTKLKLTIKYIGPYRSPQRTTKYKQHTIRSSMKQHLHLLQTPTPISTSVSSKQSQRYRYGCEKLQLHQPPRLGGRSWDGLVPMFQSLEHPKMLLSPSEGLAELTIVVLSFTWKVAKCGQCTRLRRKGSAARTGPRHTKVLAV